MSSLFKQRFLNTAVASWLVISHLVVSYELTAIAPTTATPVKQAPFSKVFFTGSVYAVKDKDYEPSEPSIGFFSLWSKDPTSNYLQVIPVLQNLVTNAKIRFEVREDVKCQGDLSLKFKKL